MLGVDNFQLILVLFIHLDPLSDEFLCVDLEVLNLGLEVVDVLDLVGDVGIILLLDTGELLDLVSNLGLQAVIVSPEVLGSVLQLVNADLGRDGFLL